MTMFFDHFPKMSDHFQKISEDFQNHFEGLTNVSEHFPKVAEDFRNQPKISEEEPMMFRPYNNTSECFLRD